jgi:hypothetical protein
METCFIEAIPAFLMREIISEMLSCMLMLIFLPYQLALVTPGICPVKASSLKHIRQTLNFPMNARLLPQRPQR